MTNIHNNEVAQRGKVNRSMKPANAENESNGMGSPGYFAVEDEEKEQETEYFVDKSDSLMSALSKLAVINASKVFVKKPISNQPVSKNIGPIVKSNFSHVNLVT